MLLAALAAPDAAEQLCALDAPGLLGAVLPEVEFTKGVAQPKEHYWDVFHHSIETVRAIPKVVALPLLPLALFDPIAHFAADLVPGHSRLTMLKLAALLHDVGKPATKSFDGKGRMRFLGHQKEGAELAIRAVSRLGLPPAAVDYVAVVVREHLRPGHLGGEEKPTDRALAHFFRDTGIAGIDVLYLNLADHLAMRGPLLGEAEWNTHLKLTAESIRRHVEKETHKRPVRLVDGHDLMRELGLASGPEVGRLLKAVENARLHGRIHTREEALDLVRKLAGRSLPS